MLSMRARSALPGKGFAGRSRRSRSEPVRSDPVRPGPTGHEDEADTAGRRNLAGGDHLAAVLELYQAESCPHSADVREAMTELGLSYVVHNPRLPGDEGGDVLNEQVHQELTAIGGEDRIPFLVDHERGESRYGSDDVVDYLHEQYGGAE
jgi:glutaredoxin